MSEYKIGDEVVIVKPAQSNIGRIGVVFDYQGNYPLGDMIPIRLYDFIYSGNDYHGYHPYEIRLITPLEKAMK